VYTVNENAGKITVPVNLAGSTELPVSINYAVTGGNATNSTDYTGGSGILSFNPGTATASFDVNILNDTLVEGNESIVLSLSSPKNSMTGPTATTTITIIDDDSSPLPTINISLVAGWNLVSIPLVLQNNSISAVLPQSVRSGLVNIWGWDEARQDWSYYSSDPADYFYQYYPAITRLETGKAYWIEMNCSATLTIQGAVPGYAPNSPATLVSGWNFVGPSGQTNSTPGVMYSSAVDVWGWDETTQNWIYYSPDPNDYFYQYYSKINTIRPGHGYWIEKI
jgi:hypothetical protein